MARFYSLTLKGVTQNAQIINTFWYRQDDIGLPSEDDLTAIQNAWSGAYMTNWLAIHTTPYVLTEIVTQGYSDQFERTPYLPKVFAMSSAGTDASAGAPPIVAAILSCKVEPQQPARRHRDGEPARYTPVRRGYWAISPISEGLMSDVGAFNAFLHSTGLWHDFKVQMAADLPVVGWTSPAKPVVVSQPPKDVTERGWGYIRQCQWSPHISTRRSRKSGVGA